MANALRVMDVAPDNLPQLEPQIKKAVKPVMAPRLAIASEGTE